MPYLQKIFLVLLLFTLGVDRSGYGQKPGISKVFLMGRFNYTTDTSFTKVSTRYADKTVYLKKETYSAFKKMYQAASKDGVDLTIISGTRSFYDQLNKWDAEWYSTRFLKIKNDQEKVIALLHYWSMPGTSRHHWGTDIDITNLNPAFYKTSRGEKMFNWMQKNAAKYGFYQPFNANRPTGYQEEKWHWSYVPLSAIYLKEYVRQVSNADLIGFRGFQAAKRLDIINNWVLGINAACK